MIDFIFYVVIVWFILAIISIVWGIFIIFPEIGKGINTVLKTIKSKTVYHKHTVGTEVIDKKMRDIIHYNRNLLLDNRVSINKIRFVFQPVFTYDVDKDVINPKYEIMLPFDYKTGQFRNNEPIIEIKKPENIIGITVDTYKFDNNFAQLKEILKNSKLGIVIFIYDDTILNPFTKNEIPYKFGVDTDIIKYADLDEKVREYKNNKSQIEFKEEFVEQIV
jgi:hypothetical protein